MEDLINGICFVVFEFGDGTHQTIRSTLNKDILLQYGAAPKENYLYDIAHAEYVKIREDAVNVMVSKEKPVSEEVLFRFADRFI